MSGQTSIEWATHVWNPASGCTKVSPGCDNCYAERFAERFRGIAGHHFEHGFDLTLRPNVLEWPLTLRKPARIFVNSMSDLFHADIPDKFIRSVWDVMERAPQHTFLVLTKRAERMLRWTRAFAPAPLANVWLGVSVENNAYAWRVDALRKAPAALRFISFEPLLGSVTAVPLDGIDWAITGGESGSRARPMHPKWAEDVLDRCVRSGAKFFHKQNGQWAPSLNGTHLLHVDGRLVQREDVTLEDLADRGHSGWVRMRRFTSKALAGRTLLCAEWSEIPSPLPASLSRAPIHAQLY